MPRGAQRGSETDLIVQGNRIADAKELLFYCPGITVTSLQPVDAQHVKVHIQVAKDARVGQYPIRLRTATGVSELRTFYVTPFPVVAEKEPNNDFAHAQPIDLNTTVAGTIDNEDVDTFVIEAKKGQHITAEAIGMRLGDAMFDPYVAIFDSKRFALAESDDTALAMQDPIASAVIPEDGKYYIQIRDTSYTGGANFHYLLSVGTFPRPTTVFPLGGQCGQKLALKCIGDVAGDFPCTLQLPTDPADKLEVLPERDGLIPPSPNFLRVSSFPNVIEREPDNDLAHATPVEQELPIALNGIISKPKETDFFKFKVHKGQVIDIRVFARALRSPLDSVIVLFNDKGQQLAANDDSGGPDSYLRFNPPADGQYILAIYDQLQHGGPDFTYRIELTPVKPSLALSIPAYALFSQERNWVSVPRGNRFATLIRGTRADFGGELKLSCPDLPPGVTMHCENMAANLDVVPVVFEAAPDAEPCGKLCDLTATSADGKTDVTGHDDQHVELVYGPNNVTMYTVDLHKLVVAVADEAPFKLRIEPPKVPIVQGGQMNLKVTAERTANFKGPISVRMLFNPPGVGSSPAVDMPADKNEIDYPISANDNAQVRKWKICVLGVADVNGPMWVSSDLADLEVAPPYVQMKIAMSATEQGKPCSVVCQVEQARKFDGKAEVKLLGLPAGATAPDMQLTSADQQLVFNVTTDPKTPVGQQATLFCQVTLMQDGQPIIHNLARGGVLRIDAPPQPKKGEAPKPVVAQAPPTPTAKPLSRLEKLRLEAQQK
ncbi:MAG TPA: PPC domain-containing protein [Tepidisphaeraceae bacterium]|nr:PPC domain-containing protein [Tepidisphaeraceae bacterium]